MFINKSKFKFLKQSGVISPLILIGVISVLVLFVVLGSLPIKDKLLGGLFPKQFSHAAGTIDLSLVPQTVSVAKDQTFLVDVAIDAKIDEPSITQLEINYDPSVMQVTAFEPGFFFNNSTSLGPPSFDNTTGKAYATLSQSPVCPSGPASCFVTYKTGTGVIATLEFKALQATVPTSAISFNSTNTQIAAIGKTGDQVGILTDSTVTVTNTPAVTKTADFSLTAPAGATAGNQFNVVLKAKSPEAANLFAAALNFNPALMEVVSINTAGSFITQWVNDNSFDNTTGSISLIGGVPNPGFTSTTASTMATIVFRAKSAGDGQINFGANSAIYRNSDNVDILITPVTGESVNITGVAPSPSPSVAPSPSPSPAVSPSPSPAASASVAPSASPSVAPSASPSPAASASPSVAPSASPSVAPSASPSPSLLACVITSANWVTPNNPVNEGKVVGLNVTGNSSCAGQNVSFAVLEDDNIIGGFLGGTDPTKNNPPSTKFNSSGVATSNWLAEYQDDPSLINNNVPEYYFVAQLTSGQIFTSANPELQVNKLSGGTFLTGDANKDGVVDLTDLSILLSNWNKTADFIDALDLNQDGVVNAIDWATMIQILRVTGIIK